MSLDWSVTQVKDHETICWEEVTDLKQIESLKKGWLDRAWREKDGKTFMLRATTHSLIFMMMVLGCEGVITAKNASMVCEQVAIYQKLCGTMFCSKDENGVLQPLYVTDDDVKAHIGLGTNCFGKGNTPAAFRKNVYRWALEYARRGAK